MKINLIMINGGLYPSLPSDREQTKKIKDGEILQYSLKKPRNAKFHRKFFGMLDLVVNNTNYNIDQLLHLVKLKIGWYESIVNTNGEEVYKAKSINFASMDEDTFELFYNKALTVLMRDFMNDVDPDDMENQIYMLLGFV